MSEVVIKEDGRITLAKDVALPEVLDVLIVGGGPAGTAAAFRAKEVGLSALVVDSDDILKRIRDYPKEKPILPDFGPVDNMKFVLAGDLVNALQFGPVDKDIMHGEWKSLYVRFNVPAQVGVELIGLERQGQLWRAKVYNYYKKAEEGITARYIILALGRGVPRRFDIPGNCDGIAFRLTDADLYTDNRPVLVIGGGTSSAEAVIAISSAKIKHSDATEVHWSYRGDKLPRVSRALADPFFEAYVGNGNVRYWPRSEPVSIVSAEDKLEYLSLRVDRRVLGGRPNETSHLEFRKEDCIACIGEDVPTAFLETLGIRAQAKAPGGKKLLVINPLMETEQRNVFLIGDTLSDKHIRAEDFADPATYQEVRRPGNVKAGLRDGVFVIEVIQQRMANKDPIVVNLQFADDPSIASAEVKAISKLTKEVDPQAPPPAALEPEVKKEEAVVAYLVRLLPGGVDEQRYPIRKSGVTTMGRTGADISIAEDTFLSDSHASVSHGHDGFMLRDDASETGVFLAMRAAVPREVPSGGLIRAGRQFVTFEISGGKAVADHHSMDGTRVGRHELGEAESIWGRTGPDVVMDPEDKSLSKRHFSVSFRDGKVYVTDLKSTNGTYLKVSPAAPIADTDEFRIGQQRFRLTVRASAETTRANLEASVMVTMTPRKPAPVAPAPAPVAAGECKVVFANLGKEFVVEPGAMLLDILDDNGIEIEAICRGGACGSDAVRVLAGAENLGTCGDLEKRTLKKLCSAEPPGTRLACMVTVNGPVTLELKGS